MDHDPKIFQDLQMSLVIHKHKILILCDCHTDREEE